MWSSEYEVLHEDNWLRKQQVEPILQPRPLNHFRRTWRFFQNDVENISVLIGGRLLQRSMCSCSQLLIGRAESHDELTVKQLDDV